MIPWSQDDTGKLLLNYFPYFQDPTSTYEIIMLDSLFPLQY